MTTEIWVQILSTCTTLLAVWLAHRLSSHQQRDIHVLVNSKMHEVLHELAQAKEQLADASPLDIRLQHEAANARRRANDRKP